ncbi:transporter, CPA2 family [Faunimonas pinastri]|uniref:Transporter, CPA2 family n=1 Tax=Faunimonas pinastri TaxID=1855383 RepID=A0A1H9APX6_9HYPH|nr:cation:proton antiporter [Faunimonas pinastri]SEP78814.1 transporter, CPA2 family [Faunimonas pinastri]
MKTNLSAASSRKLCRSAGSLLPLVGLGTTLLVASFLVISPALAAAAAGGGKPVGGMSAEMLLLLQIIVLVLFGRILGEIMQRLGQPAVMGQLIAGLLLGPSVLGVLWPDLQHFIFPAAKEQKAGIDAISNFGVLMLLLLAGMETDLSLVRRVKRAAFSVSITGIVLPFACGVALGEFLPQSMIPESNERLITSLFLGTALSISSVKIVAMVVREMNFVRRNVGQVILASAIIDDTIGWIIIAITFGLASSGKVEVLPLVKSIGGTLLFLGLSFTVGRRIVSKLIRWTNDTFISEGAVIAVILLIMGAMALTTAAIGVHTVLGAFVAGILVGESPILTRQIDEQIRGLTMGLFLPVFFGMAGLQADLTQIATHMDLALLTLGMILIASLGKFGGAFTGGWLGGLSVRESLALGTGMNARGSTEVIVATIGLSMGVLSENLFTMIVTMAVVTTLIMPPTLRWALARLPLEKEEKQRLDREAFEEKGFVPNLERILIVADNSAKAKFASRLVGYLAGPRGKPVTLLEPLAAAPERTGEDGDPQAPAPGNNDALLAAAAEAQVPASDQDAGKPVLDITRRTATGPLGEAVSKEAENGYGMLVVALARMASAKGGFDDAVTEVVDSFDGPLALVAGRGRHLTNPETGDLSILIPITGTEISRRGAEVALAIGHSANARVTALFVTNSDRKNSRQRVGATRRDHEAVLAEVQNMAKLYCVNLRTVVRLDIDAEDAILREARLGGHNLIVMGVGRRAAEGLSFGKVAAAVLESSDRSLMFVSN